MVKDEHYILDICDNVLKLKSSRQHRFDFLRGDIGKKGYSVPLPVDAYYAELNFVIEYKERQHTESVAFFDKPNVITASGVHRGEQRKIYDKRKIDVLAEHKILVIELSYTDFIHNKQKRIIRNSINDNKVVEDKLRHLKRKENSPPR
jgi:hypothetical protein